MLTRIILKGLLRYYLYRAHRAGVDLILGKGSGADYYKWNEMAVGTAKQLEDLEAGGQGGVAHPDPTPTPKESS